ncbi:hypothetical protein [Pontibacter pamirensis]|uniref:hypothetical protein n=1 Tax=Pontibacter pamirensis TaxID=2562824 RepID=UPI0013896CF9|nr:hypothetical protein [Pontibacter pamirensis]
MEDYYIILYALAAVIYFIFMQWRKAFNSPSDDADVEVPPQERRPQQPNRPPISFEDILRELQPKMERAEERGKSIVENAKEKAQQVAGPVAPAPEAPPKYRNYETEVPMVMSWERKAAEREAARQSEEIRQRLFKAETEQVKKSKYAKLLQNPTTARDAFVLTEIFKRKYD